MSERDVVAKVGDLMQTLDDVKKYREMAYAMIDFAAIVITSLIAVLALTLLQSITEIVYRSPSSINGHSFSASPWALFGDLIILLAGLVSGVFWVDRRVRRTKFDEWKNTLEEGTPGAIKLLSSVDWDSLLRTVSLARVSYLFYGLVKVVGYFLFTTIVISIVVLFSGLPLPFVYVPFISLAIVLLYTRRNLLDGFHKLQSLDLLFWDLRWFASEFKRAEFNQA